MTDAATAADDLDLDALRRCVDLMLADRELGGMVGEMLREREWRSVALFCSYSLQMDNLALKPWQLPPATGHDADAVALVERLHACGLSRFEADPIGALAALAAKEKPRRR